MKLFRMLKISIRDAFRSVFRNFSLSLASITCITITLIIVAIAVIASLNVNNFTKLIKEDVTMVVYLDRDTTTDQKNTVERQIKSLNNIATLEFKSKKQVKEQMQESSETFNSIMSSWSEEDNPLKDTFLITVKDIENIKKTSEEVKKLDKVNVVDYGEGMVDNLVSMFRVVKKVTLVAVVALIVVTTFLIINTIKLTIYSRKREISIMRLVGASNLSIKNPFVIEGMILGVLGSIIPILGTIFGYKAIYKHFDGKLFSPLISLIKPEPFIYIVSAIILGIGIVVGMIGSYRAVKKYLKV